MISIISDLVKSYPSSANFFSPHQSFPEYSFDELSSETNTVYEAVRNIFAQVGLDEPHFGTSTWNPLGEFIKPGSRVFVLCNFVYQRRPLESIRDFHGKCAHGSTLRAVIDYVLHAVGPEGKVMFGNAPLQSCDWSSVLSDTGADRVLQFYQERNLPVEACDLRLLVAERSLIGMVGNVEHRNEGAGVPIDLGLDSLLAELDETNRHFRVMDYDPRRTESFHRQNRNVYIINQKILDADVIISIPKLKTHEKVGITCAIKGCVGAVGHKDCLAHHRFGSPDQGGDEYPADLLRIRRTMSHLHDAIQTLPLEKRAGRWMRFFDRVLRRSVRPWSECFGGAWWGNDTCWRMAVDLARIITYADQAGVMKVVPVRPHLSLIDGVVGGEGQGPLAPSAVDSGVLIFGDNIVNTDWTAAILMGYDPHALPIVREATELKRYILLARTVVEESIIQNGIHVTLDELKQNVKHHYRPPNGWKNHL